MLANLYLHEFDRTMTRTDFNLVRYTDDFVVMCESADRARQAHELSRATLKKLGLEIHELGADSKSRFGEFSKHGLIFLGIRFEGQQVFPTAKVVSRFKGKIEEIFLPSSGNSLFKALQKLSNLLNGWGNCYKRMKVGKLYLELDVFVKSRVESYL